MSRVKSKNTKLEILIFNELKNRKVFFTKHCAEIIGKPDIVFKRKKIAVFIDSDFWHQNVNNPQRAKKPSSNEIYWSAKLQRNVERDKKVSEELKIRGWRVLRIWESEIKNDLNECIGKILNLVNE
jgi:DNA mismatch endonuclease (patch repair protein)